MQTRDNDKIIEIIAQLQASTRQGIIALVEAGAGGYQINSLAESLCRLESAGNELNDISGLALRSIESTSLSPQLEPDMAALANRLDLLSEKLDAVLRLKE